MHEYLGALDVERVHRLLTPSQFVLMCVQCILQFLVQHSLQRHRIVHIICHGHGFVTHPSRLRISSDHYAVSVTHWSEISISS